MNHSADTGIIEERIPGANGDVRIRKYSRGRFLGKGGFARVYELTSSETGTVFAGKCILKASLTKSRARQKLMSEIKIHKSLNHPRIVAFKHCFEDTENVYILLELCRNQTLSELMRRRKRLSELEAQCYLSQVISGLQHLHSQKVIHRDIKLGNLFLNDKMEVKIGDLGLAAKLEFDNEKRRTICGTPNYIAPEVISGTQGHSYEVDIWSLGVMLYTLLVGKPPFETQDVRSTYRRITMNAYCFPEQIDISEAAQHLISIILVTEPTARPKLQEILAHPFFSTPFPKTLPPSTLSVPPSTALAQQYKRANSLKEAKEPHSPLVPKPESPQPREVKLTRANSLKAAGCIAILSSYVPISNAGPDVWVQQWIDYSAKYGIGYLLSTNSVGVLFNDSTKIICAPDGLRFQYIHRTSPEEEEQVDEFPIKTYPAGLKKKVTLLEHFRNHLAGNTGEGAGFVYVKQWLTTAHALIFRLSNKVVQVCFHDKTELILCSHRKEVTYVNKNEEVTISSLKAVSEARGELTKRLKYTKEVLTKMLNGPLTS